MIGKKVKFELVTYGGSTGQPIVRTGKIIDESKDQYLIQTDRGFYVKKDKDKVELA